MMRNVKPRYALTKHVHKLTGLSRANGQLLAILDRLLARHTPAPTAQRRASTPCRLSASVRPRTAAAARKRPQGHR